MKHLGRMKCSGLNIPSVFERSRSTGFAAAKSSCHISFEFHDLTMLTPSPDVVPSARKALSLRTPRFSFLRPLDSAATRSFHRFTFLYMARTLKKWLMCSVNSANSTKMSTTIGSQFSNWPQRMARTEMNLSGKLRMQYKSKFGNDNPVCSVQERKSALRKSRRA